MLISRFKIYSNLHRFFIAGFLLCFILQFFFWLKAEQFKPNVHVVPPLPSPQSVAAFSFGDSQFYFRIAALRVEFAGDTFGRTTALKNYDYSQLYSWFKLLDGLDHNSKYPPVLAANYYSQSQNKEDTRYIIQYLDEYASSDINKNWWFAYQAFYIAGSILKDDDLALKLAYKLNEIKDDKVPLWVKQLAALTQAKMGDDCSSFLTISRMLQESDNGDRIIAPEEMEFMRHFIRERLDNLKKKNFNPSKC